MLRFNDQISLFSLWELLILVCVVVSLEIKWAQEANNPNWVEYR